MRILITNDDGIEAPGILLLARKAKAFGDVTVVAPKKQCSAMSHRITLLQEIAVGEARFPVEGVRAFCVDGTPADCVKLGAYHLTDEMPEIVFSGINDGCNAGLDLVYSGTANAAMEALMIGIPAIAYSAEGEAAFALAEAAFDEVTKKLLQAPLPSHQIYNVNFPLRNAGTPYAIREDRTPALCAYYRDAYTETKRADGKRAYLGKGIPFDKETYEGSPIHGSDIEAIINGYISVGTVTHPILTPDYRPGTHKRP